MITALLNLFLTQCVLIITLSINTLSSNFSVNISHSTIQFFLFEMSFYEQYFPKYECRGLKTKNLNFCIFSQKFIFPLQTFNILTLQFVHFCYWKDPFRTNNSKNKVIQANGGHAVYENDSRYDKIVQINLLKLNI